MIVRRPSPKVADPTQKDVLFINRVVCALDNNHNMKEET